MVSVNWSKEALEGLDALDSLIRERVLAKVSWLQKNFSAVVPEPLHRDLKGLYKLRVGDYRVVYTAHKDAIAIELVGHRRDIYQ